MALSSPLFLPEGGKLGFYCRHVYQEAALAKAQAKLQAGELQTTDSTLPCCPAPLRLSLILASLCWR
jgi:hypothetical protein